MEGETHRSYCRNCDFLRQVCLKLPTENSLMRAVVREVYAHSWPVSVRVSVASFVHSPRPCCLEDRR